jgi:hypothetical protein
MNEFLYKLNAPPITNFLLESKLEKLFVGQDKNLHKIFSATELLKPEYLLWRNHQWNIINFFYKTNGRQGHIHIDGYGGNVDHVQWGVNWVVGGYGKMEYWLPENVEITPAAPDDIGGSIVKCITKAPADKIYITPPGVYLINADVPHRATGFGCRYAFSLRDTRTPMSWNEVVNSFADLI